MDKIIIDGYSLSIEDVVNVARKGYQVGLSKEAAVEVTNARALVDKYVSEERVVYGITTGFGKFSDIFISKEQTEELQKNLIISHACGVGKPLAEEIVRGIMLLRANALSKGFSGVRLEVLQTLIDMINKEVHPVIPEKGSLGASGDLAPLSHMVLTMMGEGEAFYKGSRVPSIEAMTQAGIKPITLTSKEGLALINGTQAMTAIATLAVYDSINLIKITDVAAALTMEALRGIADAFDQRLHNLRPQLGQKITAKNILTLCEGSKLITRQGQLRVQDPYTLRCIPQVHGASKDALDYVKKVVEIEINSATDNPLIFYKDDEVISGGNFHGQPVALAMDFLAIALSEMANISERRIERLVNPQLSGLPAFLTKQGGLNSGFMIAQYSAASLVSENKVLAHPASVDSIPSSANQEDHVSMGTIAARKAREVLYNCQRVLAIELMAAAQAIDLRGDYGLGVGTQIAYSTVREVIPTLEEDRIMYFDIDKAANLIETNLIIENIEKQGIII